MPPCPASERTLCCFAAYLAFQGLKHQSIKNYLSAVRHLQIENECFDPFSQQTLARLELVMRGIKRYQASQNIKPRPRLPITPEILRKVKHIWDKKASDYNYVMLWAACCTCFYGFLRAGEMTVPSDNNFDPSVNLTLDDVTIDDPTRPSLIRINIKASKTDPFRKGVAIFLGRTHNDICPVAAILGYLALRGQRPGPLFQFSDRRYLTRSRFVDYVRTALQQAGIDSAVYSGHSFRIGAATTAASHGLEDSLIQTLGRWESDAYRRYIHIPRAQLASVSCVLAKQ